MNNDVCSIRTVVEFTTSVRQLGCHARDTVALGPVWQVAALSGVEMQPRCDSISTAGTYDGDKSVEPAAPGAEAQLHKPYAIWRIVEI